MDYEKLLQKYMQHVIENEGVDFVNNRSWPLHPMDGNTDIDEQEWTELKRLSKKLNKIYERVIG